MANQLKMANIQAIQALKASGWSNRRIARELGFDRETVSRYVKLAETGSKPATDQPNPPAGISGPVSLCEPFRQMIEESLEKGLTCQRIWQDLRTEHGFAGGYDSVKRFTRGQRNPTPLPFRRIERAPGQEAQLDFGKGAPVLEDGHPRPLPPV
jgi:transposase